MATFSEFKEFNTAGPESNLFIGADAWHMGGTILRDGYGKPSYVSLYAGVLWGWFLVSWYNDRPLRLLWGWDKDSGLD